MKDILLYGLQSRSMVTMFEAFKNLNLVKWGSGKVANLSHNPRKPCPRVITT